MLKCYQCGAHNQPDSKFCGACGAKLPVETPISPPHNASGVSGNAQPAGGPPPLPGAQPAAFQQTNVRPAAVPPPPVQPVRQGPPPPPSAGVPNGMAAQPPHYYGSPPPSQGYNSPPPGPAHYQAGPRQTQGWLLEKTEKLGLARNIAALLCYALGWVSGLILFFAERDPYVRFHAAQSVAIFGGINLLIKAIGIMSPMLGGLWGLISSLFSLISLASFIIWLVLMYKAYHGEYYKAPIVGDMAEQFVRNHPN